MHNQMVITRKQQQASRVLLFSQVGVMTTRGKPWAMAGSLDAEPLILTVMLPARMTCATNQKHNMHVCERSSWAPMVVTI